MILRQSQRKSVQRLSGIGKPLPPALVAILRIVSGTYSSANQSWVVPRTSKYSFHCFNGTGQYAKKTAVLTVGTTMLYWVSRGIVSANSSGGGGSGGNEPTAINGGGISVNLPWNSGTPTGGDSYTPDGSIFAPFIGSVQAPGNPNTYGLHPGGGTWSTYSAAANGEIRIVDETPA